MRPANEFCDSISSTDRFDEVKAKASNRGYRTFEYERGSFLVVKVSTQDSPFFRMACVITYSSGSIVSKEVLADD